jgi:hypothetical protein
MRYGVRVSPKQKPRLEPGFCADPVEKCLLDLTFFVHDVLAYDGIVLFHFKFVRRGALVFVRGIKMSGTSGGIHSDFLSHGNSPLNDFTARADIGQYLFNSVLVNYTHSLARNPQGHETFFRGQPETMLVQVGQKTTPGTILGM